jgi:lysozyme
MLELLLDDLRRDEGWRDRPYRDTEGYLTIGYGFLIDERKPVRLPQKVADVWLKTLVEQKRDELRAKWSPFDTMPEDVQRGLLNMAYQLGVAGLLGFKRMLAALEVNDRVAAANHGMDSRWFKQTPERAKRVLKLIRGY